MPAAPTVVAVLHKPGGLLTTMDDAHGRPCVASVVPDAWAGVCGPVGRLDKATTGALLFTDDGALHASVAAGAPKTYRLTIRGPVSERQLERLRTGVTIRRARVSEANRGDFLTAPAQASRWEEGVLLTIREGRNRQVRRMAKVVGLELVHLHRDSVGPVRCPPEEGGLRDLRAEEVDALLAFGPSAAERKARAARDLRARRARGALSDRELQLVDEWLLEWTKDNEIRFVAPG